MKQASKTSSSIDKAAADVVNDRGRFHRSLLAEGSSDVSLDGIMSTMMVNHTNLCNRVP